MHPIGPTDPLIQACFMCPTRQGQLHELNRLKAQNKWLEAQNTKYEHAIRWALGETGDFPDMDIREPFAWRKQLSEKSGVIKR